MNNALSIDEEGNVEISDSDDEYDSNENEKELIFGKKLNESEVLKLAEQLSMKFKNSSNTASAFSNGNNSIDTTVSPEKASISGA
jgi:hypothetical protein